jgi:isopenicillin-N epimerase
MKEHWLLDPEITFLNHGSFGATPLAVLSRQDEFRSRMEREPVRFLVRELEPLLDEARGELARFVGADPEDLAFVPNATAGVNAVLQSLDLTPDDELLVTNQEYNACRNAIDYVAGRSGARVNVVEIPFPIDDPEVVFERVVAGVTDSTRLLLIDHITSQTALIFPVERLVAEMNARGIDTLIDGAHAPGMIPLDLRAIGSPYYAANLHKWVCAPKGAGFLHVRPDRRDGIRPVAISHGANSPRIDRSRFHLEFDWTGTFDPTPWLSVGEALRFLPSLVDGGWPEVMQRNHALALRARDILCHALEIEKPAPDDMLGSMAAFPLPDGTATEAPSLYGDPLQDVLLEQYRIEVPVVPWPHPPKRLLRVSAQLYNRVEEYERLASALIECVA